ncbi:hypothetical protein LAU42_07210 [Macrococcus armenti]|uniref:hypothetical protein n=1 Tax=Macrococcus armenti TaxID=2875764 RepID=UPI001CCFD2D5|nr:hypothetical protein [Macrococcus armenti]UBH21584.1 hypothetical protein LAU42_07210 [Macrococcus armenti]
MGYEKMWNKLKEHIETIKSKAYENGFEDDYEQYLHFAEVVRNIENTSGERLEKENK